ncbi:MULTISPECIES: MFS transporter [Idiomarina]|jgi:NNP family nitrate/nitrite transporter-like MFS transporter|uniref:MFS transporter n=4 Tax=Idiomarina abyssalis TaxID=86102 RepID=A0A8I1KHW4_9GAMM|nr:MULTISPECIES: MFS transporter [Idiomarina]MAO68861.1 MFS transporter [Idiomarina sp.]MBF81091.1 MFS transporter [Idiomarina sp.]MBJ7266288.1 MFS transporter [Idiomarina abyssalis]MBJ7272655.1 MFS transporter [Idiomarina abyssalis]MBJ7316427.1 MFS transporter [Idiomarina abyssalis]|tara:strand:+ start:750 stop:3419 length:2670 start_codon:yes stop_codon:yes gene_type:complete
MNQPLSVTGGQRNRALAISTLAFTLCFAVWTIFSIIGIQIKADFNLTDTQLGLLMATPVLTGSISRMFLGIWTDQYGGRKVFSILMLLTAACVYLLTFANSYIMLLIAALGVGLAGGSFIVGVTYTAAWFNDVKEKQGTALGIFGAGNVGSAVTNFGAPFLLIALGWQGTAQIYATVLAIAGVVFLFLAKDDPLKETRQELQQKGFWEQLSPLGDLRVWRFSLYYFFVFGAFVALALWLPHYLIGVYELDIKTAGMIAALYTVPASLFRILGGWMSDKYGARRVMYWTFIASVICTFLLSYPSTEYAVKGVNQTYNFHFEITLLGFVFLTFALGFFMSLGKAAVFKHIPVYYPKSVGAVGGVVGMIGGLGGFLLPLTFGMLNDVIGVWQSSFMLLFVIAAAALAWMHFAILRAERVEYREDREERDLPELSTPNSMVLDDWRPEDKTFWEEKGKRIATRNLWISIPNLFLAFAVWTIWSILVVKMPALGFPYSQNELFWLAALPALSGATLRIFYSFMVPIFGGRRWTAISTASLLLPCIWIGFAVQNTDTPYMIMLILALLCGFGGGNFSSSMSNISFFYPQKEKGGALGMNAGLGNLGVSGMQLLAPLVIAASVFGGMGGDPLVIQEGANAGQEVWLQNAAFLWVPLIVIGSVAAWFGMNDISSAKASFSDQAVIFKRSHNWIMCILYLGTFGSFIGFAAGFPLLSGMLFPEVDPTAYAFLGPLVGALARPVGGIVADKLGGARVTFWNFLLMIAGVAGVMYFLPIAGTEGNFWGFFAAFMVLFIATGIGNGSTFRMVPVIFLNQRKRELGDTDEAIKQGNKESAAVIGFISAFAAYGGFFIPKAYGSSISLTGSVSAALVSFIVFYAICSVITWWFYSRKNAPDPC